MMAGVWLWLRCTGGAGPTAFGWLAVAGPVCRELGGEDLVVISGQGFRGSDMRREAKLWVWARER